MIGYLCGFTCFTFFFLWGMVDLYFGFFTDKAKLAARKKEREQWIENVNEAERSYKTHLAMLEQDPSNPQTKKETLELGREYSEISRKHAAWLEQRGSEVGASISIFDEMTLSNDLAAACAGASTSVDKTTTETRSVKQRIAELDELLESGIISRSEYDEKRKKVLDDI